MEDECWPYQESTIIFKYLPKKNSENAFAWADLQWSTMEKNKVATGTGWHNRKEVEVDLAHTQKTGKQYHPTGFDMEFPR